MAFGEGFASLEDSEFRGVIFYVASARGRGKF